MLYGGPGSGKSSLAYRVCGYAQQLGGICCWFDTELSFSEPLALINGVDMKYIGRYDINRCGDKFYGEDHWFAHYLREMGTRMFIFPNVDIVHWGYKDFRGNYDEYLRKSNFIPEKKLIGESPGAVHTFETATKRAAA